MRKIDQLSCQWMEEEFDRWWDEKEEERLQKRATVGSVGGFFHPKPLENDPKFWQKAELNHQIYLCSAELIPCLQLKITTLHLLMKVIFTFK